jgi:prepilin-type N-terminal cleavage/methylation domain-containing protein
MKRRYSAGFTLMEMAIVLVIIGIIIGGIMFGKSVLVTSRLQTVMTDEDNYATAVANFRQTYQALPGDMANATSNWGTSSGGCPGGTGSGTCNGNGDGMIGPSGSGTEPESFRFWQQLYLAGMMNKSLSGVATSGGALNATIGTNVPAGSILGSGFIVGWYGTADATNIYVFPGFYGNVLVFGATYPNLGTSGPILTPDQAAAMDAKIDDGIPGTGKVRAMISTSSVTPNCTTSANIATAKYNVSSSAVLCSLLFISGY